MVGGGYHSGGAAQPGIWDESSAEGSLSPRHVAELVRVLARHTNSPGDCFFGIWEGFGDLLPSLVRDVPKLPMPDRHMVLLRGSPVVRFRDVLVRRLALSQREPLVAGDGLLDDPALEVMRVTSEQLVTRRIPAVVATLDRGGL